MKVGDAERSPFVGYVSLWGLSNDLNVIGRREAEPACWYGCEIVI